MEVDADDTVLYTFNQ